MSTAKSLVSCKAIYSKLFGLGYRHFGGPTIQLNNLIWCFLWNVQLLTYLHVYMIQICKGHHECHFQSLRLRGCYNNFLWATLRFHCCIYCTFAVREEISVSSWTGRSKPSISLNQQMHVAPLHLPLGVITLSGNINVYIFFLKIFSM